MILNTSGSKCIVGILDTDTNKFHERVCSEKNKHAELLFRLIDSVLLDSDLTYGDISDIAAVVGPGSFTGLRVSLSAVQGFKLASRVSVHGITLLELHAYLIFRSLRGNNENIVSVVKTQNDTLLYSQVFSNELIPITQISFESRDDVFSESNRDKIQSLDDLSKKTRFIGEYLTFKLSHNLPHTPLVPVYSRFYS